MVNHLRIIGFHGFLGQSRDFDFVLSEIKKKLPNITNNLSFYAPDLFSPVGEDILPTSFSNWGDVFFQKILPRMPFALNADIRSKRILMGYSLGGRLALDLFLHNPEAFDAVVLLAPNPGLISPQEKQKRLLSDQTWSEKIKADNWLEFISAWNSQEIFVNKGSYGRPEPIRHRGDYSLERLKRALTHLSLGHMRVTPDLVRRFQSQIYWLSGENDPKIHPLYQTLKAEGVIRHWMTIPQSGHRLLFDNPNGVADHLVQIANL